MKTTDVGSALDDVRIYFDAQLTSAREPSVGGGVAAGKPIYARSPRRHAGEALRLAKLAKTPA